MRGNWTSVVLAAALAWAGTAMAGETARDGQSSSMHTGTEQQPARTGSGDASTAGATSDPSAMPDDPSRDGAPPGESQGAREGEDVRTGYQGDGSSTSGSASTGATSSEESDDLDDPASARETETDRQMQGEGDDRKPGHAGGK